MSGSAPCPPRRLRLLWGCVCFALLGAAVMCYLQDFELASRTKYHRDLTQSPHWVAYHGDSFAENDLLVRYGAYNESPLQNAVYWVGTLFTDLLPLNKLVGVITFGLTAALFFLLVTRMSGARVGALAAFFFLVFPHTSYEIAGGFSKAWAIPLALTAVYAVDRRAWRIVSWVMPFAALAYPVSAVLIGTVVLVGLLLDKPFAGPEARRGLKYLAAGSVPVLILLLAKYLSRPDFIGEMISPSVLREMWETDLAPGMTQPLAEEVVDYLRHPFFYVGIPFVVILLSFRWSLVWRRSWTALLVASTVLYAAADLVIPRLGTPDLYTRYSAAVFLVLWSACNWDRVIGAFRRSWVRGAVLAALVVVAATSFRDTFKPCDGARSLGRWEDRGHLADVSRAVAALPEPVLLAGHPEDTACVMIQARRPVLAVHRMFHPWFDEYRTTMDARNRDTLGAFYAWDADAVNRLAETYGVTHILVRKSAYSERTLDSGLLYVREYEKLVVGLARGRDDFVLLRVPRDAILFEDKRYRLIRLPLEEEERLESAPVPPVEAPIRQFD